MPSESSIRVYCLGHFRIERIKSGAPFDHVQQKPLALLKMLIALGAQHVPQDRIVDSLWPDSDGDAAQTAFTSTLYRLRQLAGPNALVLRNRQLSLDPEQIWWDVHAFEAALDELGNDGGATSIQSIEQLMALYRGPFLAGESEPIEILSMRERLQGRFLRAIRNAGEGLEQTGRLDAAIDIYGKALEVHPLAEELCQRCMRALVKMGRNAEAANVYQQLRRNMIEQGGAMPSRLTEAILASEIRPSPPSQIPETIEELAKRAPTSIAVPQVAEGATATAQSERRQCQSRVPIRSAGAVFTLFIVGFAAVLFWPEKQPDRFELPPFATEAPKIPEGPSIVVLPFLNMSNDPTQEDFTDGLTDTLITDLSQLQKILVIARNSAFSYKGRAVDVRQIAKELGVRHVLEGGVQTTNNRLRINVQLIEAATGSHIWAQRYDSPLKDIFLIQDEIANRIVEELDVSLVTGEQARMWRRMTKNPVAYSEVLVGRAMQGRNHSIDGMIQSRVHFRRAIELDPNFALPWAYMVSIYQHLTDNGYVSEPDVSYETALKYADQAVKLNPELPIARAYRGSILQQLERHDEAAHEFRLAVEKGPNAAESLMLSAWGIAAVGDAGEALAMALRGFRLDPVPPGWYWGALADTYLRMQQWKQSIPVFERCLVESTELIWCRAGLTVAYARAGRMEDARRSAEEWRRIDKKVTAQDNFYLFAWRDAEFRKILAQSLAEAGL
jgi:TolB-like protein/DNA-binding SARP family transcriptional activator